MFFYKTLFFLPFLYIIFIQHTKNFNNCKVLPEDSLWPSITQWNDFNYTIDGRLIATIPIGSPCHNPNYDSIKCAYIKANLENPSLHYNSSSSLMSLYFATLEDKSCNPYSSKSSPCFLGNYISYTVNASKAEDVIAAIKFAKTYNIRFVIRNTGHDFLGRSTGAGALAIWTHYLKDISFSDWSSDYYTGKAMTIGAGVQGFEAIEATHGVGLLMVGGSCPTVGIAGGYTQGGGHSTLSTRFGTAADQTLSWEVVTAEGKIVIASRTENSDLYWALSGGGGGTYGVVLSLTVRVYPDALLGGATLSFSTTASDSKRTNETFWTGIEAFHSHLPTIVDAGIGLVYVLFPGSFQITNISGYNKTRDDIQVILSNFTNTLTTLGINYKVAYTEHKSYIDHYDQYFGPLPLGPSNGIAGEGYHDTGGGRLIPRSVIQKNNNAYIAVLRDIIDSGISYTGIALNVSSSYITSTVDNALLPAWRDMLIQAVITIRSNYTSPISDIETRQLYIVNKILPQFEALTLGGGAYMNEDTFRQTNWQQAFFGKNYARLLEIKRKWDPDHFFYAVTTVGSEAWSIGENGRMCRTEI